MKKKILTFFSALLPAVASYALQLIILFWTAFFFLLVLFLRGIYTVDDLTSPKSLTQLSTHPTFLLLNILLTGILGCIFFYLWHRKRQKKMQEPKASLKSIFCIRNLLIFLVSGLSMQIAISMLLNVILPLFPSLLYQYETLISNYVIDDSVLSLLSYVLFLPFMEELIFRDLTLKKLEKAFPFWAANLLQALFFCVYHLNMIQAIYTFFGGLLLGLVAKKFHSYVGSFLLHASVNLSAFYVIYLIPEALLQSLPAMLILSVLCIGIVILLYFLYKKPVLLVPLEEGASSVELESIPTKEESFEQTTQAEE